MRVWIAYLHIPWIAWAILVEYVDKLLSFMPALVLQKYRLNIIFTFKSELDNIEMV